MAGPEADPRALAENDRRIERWARMLDPKLWQMLDTDPEFARMEIGRSNKERSLDHAREVIVYAGADADRDAAALRERAEAAERRVAELEGALRPFADLAAAWPTRGLQGHELSEAIIQHIKPAADAYSSGRAARTLPGASA